MSIRVLILDDEALIRWSLRRKLEERNWRVTEADSGRAACDAIESESFDLALLDYKLPDMTGVDVLRKLRQLDTDTVAVMMTAYSSIESAVEAIKLGAYDYLPKPFDMEHLLLIVDKALETTRLRRENRELRRKLEAEYGTDTIIGRSQPMREMLGNVQQIARSSGSTVLLRGETGTGKDLVARVIHHASERAGKPFVNVTCTALSETLLESELFGHERGAFTDAKTQKKGLFELADGGTVFLDEIGDMAGGLQAKLLRFLEERRFRRVGGTNEITVDVRIIAATNRDIENMIQDGRFREDLFYRLNVLRIDLPPLRACGDDVVQIAQHFIDRFAREFKRTIVDIEPEAAERLRRYGWPGNVRELRNVIERAVLLAKDDRIAASDIVVGRAEPRTHIYELEHMTLPPDGFDLNKLSALELRLLKQAMHRTDQNQVQAAKLLHVSRDRLRYRLQKYGLL